MAYSGYGRVKNVIKQVTNIGHHDQPRFIKPIKQLYMKLNQLRFQSWVLTNKSSTVVQQPCGQSHDHRHTRLPRNPLRWLPRGFWHSAHRPHQPRPLPHTTHRGWSGSCQVQILCCTNPAAHRGGLIVVDSNRYYSWPIHDLFDSGCQKDVKTIQIQNMRLIVRKLLGIWNSHFTIFTHFWAHRCIHIAMISVEQAWMLNC